MLSFLNNYTSEFGFAFRMNNINWKAGPLIISFIMNILQLVRYYSLNLMIIKFQEFQDYLVKNIEPDVVAGRVGKWNLVKHGQKSATSNLSESGNALLNRLNEWKTVPIDAIVLSLLHFCNFQDNEIVLSR